ncbi:uncharacterized protein LOC128558582 [Mercenaria mercenaria]|uniref:uncharacterized protein LOC128558582 n=1 Tax=Mercenaria mercenaria TaxID=6596 RepID=UPI00234F169B|nr:uncharacterized protein LOC128558582 [Mercenaria mercenaria]
MLHTYMDFTLTKQVEYIYQNQPTMFYLRHLVVIFGFLSLTGAAFTDLENFIRVLGSLDPNQSIVNYLNGSVFGKQPGSDLQKLFNYEGYNINRKIRQQDGSFLSLSREFVVYRQPNTSQILQVWINPWSNKANEIFYVANDPVNAILDSPSPSQRSEEYIIYNSDIVLEYPNPLSPDKYSNYSAGPIYDSVELFAFFANYTNLRDTLDKSVPFTGTWIRKSEYLPWMEMSTKPGCLYYTTMAWKCNEGLSCVSDDIMQLIKKYYPKYEYAPSQKEVPNETSWTVFKKVIDQRRQAGLPDIIIPQVNTTSNIRTMTDSVDDRVLNILDAWPLSIKANGSAWSEIPGKQSVCFFNMFGYFQFDLEHLPEHNGYRIQLDGFVTYRDAETGKMIKNFTNPITGQNNTLPKSEVGVDFVFKKDSFYTIDIPSSEVVGLLGAQSSEGTPDDDSDWSVNFIDLVFPYNELSKPPTSAHFFGTLASYSSWPSWMEMMDVPGNIVVKLTVSK